MRSSGIPSVVDFCSCSASSSPSLCEVQRNLFNIFMWRVDCPLWLYAEAGRTLTLWHRRIHSHGSFCKSTLENALNIPFSQWDANFSRKGILERLGNGEKYFSLNAHWVCLRFSCCHISFKVFDPKAQLLEEIQYSLRRVVIGIRRRKQVRFQGECAFMVRETIFHIKWHDTCAQRASYVGPRHNESDGTVA